MINFVLAVYLQENNFQDYIEGITVPKIVIWGGELFYGYKFHLVRANLQP